MLTFPYTSPADAPQVGAVRGVEFRTEISTSRSGIERRRATRTLPTAMLSARWGAREDARAIAAAIEAFFISTRGAATSFVAFDFDPDFPHTGVYVGTTDGAEDEWVLPCKTTATSLAVFLDGVLQASGYTVTDDGANGRKKITFTAPPAAGKAITLSFTGQRAWVCRFESDVLELEFDEAGLYALSLRLREVKGE